jgi:hypothetical protein
MRRRRRRDCLDYWQCCAIKKLQHILEQIAITFLKIFVNQHLSLSENMGR